MTVNNSDDIKGTGSSRGRKPRAQVQKNTASQVDENTRHISENAQDIQNNTKMIHILYSVIILLMVIIAGLAFWLGSVFSGGSGNGQINSGNINGEANRTGRGIDVTIIGDERCTNCMTGEIISQFRTSAFLSEANFIEKDFSDEGVRELLESNNIQRLPAILFSDNNLWDGGQISPFLTLLADGNFQLELGEVASFDPFMERSERGFLTLDLDILEQIKANSYVNGDENADITWIEYSDFGCTFCVRMHAEDKTVQGVLENFPGVVNNRFQHMAFRNRDVPEAIECIAEQAGEAAFNTLVSSSFDASATSRNDVLAIADSENINFNTTEYESCISDGRMKRKIESHMEVGQNIFGVTGTPGNVLVNVNTGEFELISGAYPQSFFEEVIERLR
ncbi:thioredoxin domain-containing protein [Candidatus Gracilibacteria bacterium]|nr:thioredoxin domain-containing protein [Candidatus Gracilibacteria bacterium]